MAEQNALFNDMGLVEDKTPDQISAEAEKVVSALYDQFRESDLPEGCGSVEEMGWMALWEELTERLSWDWRKAAFIAWSAWVGDKYPAKQYEFANLLGLKSDRQFYTWRHKNPAIDEDIDKIRGMLMKDAIRQVDNVSLAVSLMEDYKSTQERRLFYQRNDVMAQDNTLKVQMDDISGLSDAELLRRVEEEKARLGSGEDAE